MSVYAVLLEHLAVYRAVTGQVAHEHGKVAEGRGSVCIAVLDPVALRHKSQYALCDEPSLGYRGVILAGAVLIYDIQLCRGLGLRLVLSAREEALFFVIIYIADLRRHELGEEEIGCGEYFFIASEILFKNNLSGIYRIVTVVQSRSVFSFQE